MLASLVRVLLALLLLAPISGADVIPLYRRSWIEGGGAHAFDIAHTEAESFDLTADFDKELQLAMTGDWVEEYQVHQHSSAGPSGFFCNHSFSGSAILGEFRGVSAQSYFKFIFYVDRPSVLVLSGDQRASTWGGLFFRELSRNGTEIGWPGRVLWAPSSGDIYPATIPLSADPSICYEIFIHDGDRDGPFNEVTIPFAYAGSLVGTVTAVPPPQPILRNVTVGLPTANQGPTISATVSGGVPNTVLQLQASLDLGRTDPWTVIGTVNLDGNGSALLNSMEDPRPIAADAPADFFRLLSSP